MAAKGVVSFLALCALCLAAVPAPVACAQGKSAAAIAHNEKGLEYFTHGFHQLEPRSRRAEADQFYDLAAGEFNRAIGLNPNYVEAHRNLARVYFVQKKFSASADSYKKVVALDPADVDAAVNLALACVELQRYDEAISHLEKARTRTADERVRATLSGYIEKVQKAR